MTGPDVLFRAEDYLTGFPFHEDGIDMSFTPVVRVAFRTYRITKYTPCGAWIDLGFGERKFVNLQAHKRWACPTQKEAVESFLARKRRQIRILNGQIDRATAALAKAEADLVDRKAAEDFQVENVGPPG